MFTWLLTAALALAPATTDTPPQPAELLQPPSPEQVLAIPDDLRAVLHARVVVQGGASDQQRLERLVRFMFDPDGLGMIYQHDGNYTVAEAWRTRKANCLTFTLLTIALAREAGIDAYGQEIARTLSWYSEGDTLYFSNHVNTGIRVNQHRFSIDVASDSVLAGEPPKRISDDRLLAIYYSNRAASLLAENKLTEAGAYMAAALRMDDGYASAWNNVGVLSLRQGRPDEAERHFLKALEVDRLHDGALMNLASLYAGRGDRRKEAEFRTRIERARQRNPFHYFMLAMDDEKRGNYEDAAAHYRRAIKLYDGEHRFHYGLARAYLHLGSFQKAGEALRRAQAVAGRNMGERYQAKLDQLRHKGL